MDRIADFRNVFAQVVLARAASSDAALLEAFARVPRHEFLPRGPWAFSESDDKTQTDDPALVYQDMSMGLVPERGIPTGQPSLHARCIAACALRPEERVVHIGAGSGYYTAILAELVGPRGRVIGFELDQELAETARTNLKPWPWACIESASGVDATFEAADLIYVTAAVQKPPRSWYEHLRPQGRLLFPLTPSSNAATHSGGRVEYSRPVASYREGGGMCLIRERGSPEVFSAEFLCRAHFVPCLAAQDEDRQAELAEAFANQSCADVRSLRLWPSKPDASAWFVGSGFWLSTANP